MDVVAGRYEVEREIGRGGMGVVLLARDTTLGRQVALKRLTLDPVAGGSEEATRRFMREARLTSQLSHPCIVNLFDVLESDHELYLVLEYYESESLSARLARTGPLGEAEARKVGGAVASALGYAHGEGVVHRDVKPDNILLGAKGAKLTDFGIARLAEGKHDSDTKLTQTGYYVGTPGYMSPEQVKGDSASAASDVFSVGLVVYYALTGEEPFGSGGPAAVLYRIVHEPIDLASLPVSDDLKAWMAAATAKDPSYRPDALTLAAGLDAVSGVAQSFSGSAPSDALPPAAFQATPAPVAQPSPTPVPMPSAPVTPLPMPSVGGPVITPPPTPAPFTPPPTPPYPPQPYTAEARSHHGFLIAVLVLLLVIVVAGVGALFLTRKPSRTQSISTDYSSPQGFTVVLPQGWVGHYEDSDRIDRLENSALNANVFVSKIGPARSDLKNMGGDALIDEYVKRQLQLEGKLQLKEDIVTVNKNDSFGDFDAVSFEFEVVDSANRSRYTAEMYIFSTYDSLWAVLDFAPRGSFESARDDFNKIENSFAQV